MNGLGNMDIEYGINASLLDPRNARVYNNRQSLLYSRIPSPISLKFSVFHFFLGDQVISQQTSKYGECSRKRI